MLSHIKKPEDLPKKGKKQYYIELYKEFTDMEKKYTDLLYKFDKIKKDNNKKQIRIDSLENKIIDIELIESKLSMNVDNMKNKTIKVIQNTVKNLKILEKELDCESYECEPIIKETYHESALDNFCNEFGEISEEI